MGLRMRANDIWIEPFSSRELEVLQLLSDGFSNREIAEQLFLSVETVKWYNKQMFLKLGVNSRIQAANKAAELNLLQSKRVNPSQTKRRKSGNLPAQLSSYVGREKEISEVKDLLGDNRLVMLTGAGGSGKTRLALQVAEASHGRYPDGIWLVELAKIRDPGLVIATIANVLNIPGKPDADISVVLKRELSQLNLLLVIDNLEHLLDSAQKISELLAAAPQISILGTSRERMHIYGEQEYPVQPLSLPDLSSALTSSELEEIESIILFIQRAKAVNPGLSLNADSLECIARICVQLDGLPLAIELCAPMVKIFPLSEIADRIESNLRVIPSSPRDLPARQQTLRHTLEWSLDLLEADEKLLLQRLAIFRGGAGLDAIKSICAEGISSDVDNLIFALVNKNLVLDQEQSDGIIRFGLLETIRQYNLERISTSGELNYLAARHAKYFSGLAQESAKHLISAKQVAWLEKLEGEHENLRAAMEWHLTTAGRAESGLMFATSLEYFWDMRGYFSEGIEHLSAALSRPGASERTLARANALNAIGHLTYLQSRYPETRQYLEESLSIFREHSPNDQEGLAHALITLGDMETELGNYSTATTLMSEALEIMRALDDTRGISRALWQLGACAVRPGNYGLAVQYFEEALPLLRKIGDRTNTTIALSGLAEVAIRQGDYDRATQLEEESLKLRRELGEPWGIAVSLANFGWIAMHQGDKTRAVELLNESLILRRDIGERGGCAWCLEKLAEVALINGAGEALLDTRSEYIRAARLYGAAEEMREPVESKIDQVDQHEYDQKVAMLREQLGEEVFTQAWHAGRGMTREQSIEYALRNPTISSR